MPRYTLTNGASILRSGQTPRGARTRRETLSSSTLFFIQQQLSPVVRVALALRRFLVTCLSPSVVFISLAHVLATTATCDGHLDSIAELSTQHHHHSVILQEMSILSDGRTPSGVSSITFSL
ncbi:hypothetical protein ElyMa_005499600 [Elysia marginata]|uniref:Uncharacterized protein n=1 Tax=Elysia marginata TaxID=1093978 RepID=A0AAV4ESQ9_9GAST|nr:hypothetical protein ElyMa_005499600 [Elysia marginata]